MTYSSNLRFDWLVDSLPVTAYVCDANGLLARYNERAAALWGRRPKSLDPMQRFCGAHRVWSLTGELLETEQLPMARVLRFAQPTKQELIIERPDGHRVKVLAKASPIFDDHGSLAGALCVFHELELESSRTLTLERLSDFHETIIRTAAEGICVCYAIDEPPYVSFTVWNDRMVEITGYTKDEINCLGWHETLYADPAVRERAIERMSRMRQGDDLRNEEWEIAHKDGSSRVLSFSTSRVRLDSGEPAVVAMIQDVTQQRRTQRELEENRRRLQLAIEVSKLGLWEWDLETNSVSRTHSLKSRSNSALAPSQASLEELTGLIHPLDRSKVFDALDSYLRGNAADFNIDFRIVPSDGNHRWIHTEGIVQRDAEGNAVRMLGCHKDVTNQKRTEEMLEHIVKSVTAEAGEPYFARLVKFLCETCEVDYATVAEFDETAPGRAQTIAWAAKGELQEPLAYTLQGTPCGNVWGSISVCYYAEGVSKTFPEDKMLVDAGIECYLGIPLVSANGRAIGLLSLMHTQPLVDPTRATTLLQVLASRTGVELERLRVERAVRTSEETLSRIAATMPQALYVFNVSTLQTEFTNREVSRDLGYSEEDMASMGKDVLGVLAHPDDLARVPELIARWNTIPDGVVIETEYRMKHADGQWRWFLGRDTVHERDAQGNVIKIIGTTQDVTQRKQAEVALRESEERLSSLVRNAPNVCIQWFDDQGKVLLWNEASEGLFGYTSDQAIGKRLEELIFDKAESERFYRVMEKIAESSQPEGPMEFEFHTRDGQTGTVVSSIFRIPGHQGSDWFVCMDIDITARKKDEEDRLRLESQIQHTQKLESLGVLAGGIAHDFNNLLTTIQGYSELARTALPEDSGAVAHIDEAIKGVQSAAELTRQMLAYSGKGRLSIQPIDLSDLVNETSRLLEISISKRSQLVRRLSPSLAWCEGDVAQVRQVIMNLIINASESIGENSGVITVSTSTEYCRKDQMHDWLPSNELPEGEYVVLEVADDGCGMSPETVARIFDPFFTTKFTGRGLGMAAVLGIIRSHRGAVQVRSQLEAGSVFRIYLPVTEKPAEPVSTCESISDSWQGRGVVLVADDEPSVRKLACTMVSRLGFDPIEASDGQEALELFAEHRERISFVLLDMTMPRMDGNQTLARLREIAPQVAVILISGFDEQTAITQSLDPQINGFLQKPFRFEALKSMIQSVFAKA